MDRLILQAVRGRGRPAGLPVPRCQPVDGLTAEPRASSTTRASVAGALGLHGAAQPRSRQPGGLRRRAARDVADAPRQESGAAGVSLPRGHRRERAAPACTAALRRYFAVPRTRGLVVIVSGLPRSATASEHAFAVLRRFRHEVVAAARDEPGRARAAAARGSGAGGCGRGHRQRDRSHARAARGLPRDLRAARAARSRPTAASTAGPTRGRTPSSRSRRSSLKVLREEGLLR